MTQDTSNLNDTTVKSSFVSFLDNKSSEETPKGNKNLEKIIENTKSIIKILSDSNLIEHSDVKREEDHHYSGYSELGIPLYIIHFVKYCNKEKIIFGDKITLTTYENLCKENNYRICRIAGHMILMWKQIKENSYAILSIIPKDIDELDFNQNKYFVTVVDIDDITSWQKFNTLSRVELYHEQKLKSFKDALTILINYE